MVSSPEATGRLDQTKAAETAIVMGSVNLNPLQQRRPDPPTASTFKLRLPSGPGHLPTRFHLIERLPKPEKRWLAVSCESGVESEFLHDEEVKFKSTTKCAVVLIRGQPYFVPAIFGSYSKRLGDGSEGEFEGGASISISNQQPIHEGQFGSLGRGAFTTGPWLDSAILIHEGLAFNARMGWGVKGEVELGESGFAVGIGLFIGGVVVGKRGFSAEQGIEVNGGGTWSINVEISRTRPERR